LLINLLFLCFLMSSMSSAKSAILVKFQLIGRCSFIFSSRVISSVTFTA
jgi:hypothetical protein